MPFNEDAHPVSVRDPDGVIYAEMVDLPGTTRLLPGMLEFLQEEGKFPTEHEEGKDA